MLQSRWGCESDGRTRTAAAAAAAAGQWRNEVNIGWVEIGCPKNVLMFRMIELPIRQSSLAKWQLLTETN